MRSNRYPQSYCYNREVLIIWTKYGDNDYTQENFIKNNEFTIIGRYLKK